GWLGGGGGGGQRSEGGRLQRVRAAGSAPAPGRARVAQALPRDVLRDGAVARQDGAQAGVPGPDRGHRRRAVRDVGRLREGAVVRPGRGGGAGRPVLPAGVGPRGEAVRRTLGQHRLGRRGGGQAGDRRPVRGAGGRRGAGAAGG